MDGWTDGNRHSKSRVGCTQPTQKCIALDFVQWICQPTRGKSHYITKQVFNSNLMLIMLRYLIRPI